MTCEMTGRVGLSAVDELEKPTSREHLSPSPLPPSGGFRILAPLLDLPVLVDLSGGPGLIRREPAMGMRQRQERRAHQRRHDVKACEREGIKPLELRCDGIHGL